MADRYQDAATVSDEHGKGSEILRQQVINVAGNHTVIVMEAEVDLLLRNLRFVSTSGMTAGTVQFVRRRGGVSADITAVESIVNASGYSVTDFSLAVGRDFVRKGDLIVAATTGLVPAGSNVSIIVEWMPDLWGPSADAKTY